MKMMTARYRGRCAGCNMQIHRGDPIGYDGSRRLAFHTECVSDNPERQWVAITTSGGTFYRNVNGRCIDAPCCGCCT